MTNLTYIFNDIYYSYINGDVTVNEVLDFYWSSKDYDQAMQQILHDCFETKEDFYLAAKETIIFD